MAGAMALAFGSAQAAPKKPAQKPAATIAKDVKERALAVYGLAMMQGIGIKTCADLKASVKGLIPAPSVMLSWASYFGPNLLTKGFEKGEYETTAEFELRRNIGVNLYFGEPKRAIYYGDIDPDDQSYDADEQTLKIRMPKGVYPEHVLEGVDSKPVLLKYREKNNGIKSGQTRLGVKFQYKSYTISETYLVLVGIDRSNWEAPADVQMEPTAYLKVPRERAIKPQDSLRFVILGEVAEPYARLETNEDSASLDDPVDLLIFSEVYYAKPKCGYVFDNATGEVLHTLFEAPLGKLEPVKLNTPPSP